MLPDFAGTRSRVMTRKDWVVDLDKGNSGHLSPSVYEPDGILFQ